MSSLPSVTVYTPLSTGTEGVGPYPSTYSTFGTLFNRNEFGIVRGPPTLSQGSSGIFQMTTSYGGIGSDNPAFLAQTPYVSMNSAYHLPSGCASILPIFQNANTTTSS